MNRLPSPLYAQSNAFSSRAGASSYKGNSNGTNNAAQKQMQSNMYSNFARENSKSSWTSDYSITADDISANNNASVHHRLPPRPLSGLAKYGLNTLSRNASNTSTNTDNNGNGNGVTGPGKEYDHQMNSKPDIYSSSPALALNTAASYSSIPVSDNDLDLNLGHGHDVNNRCRLIDYSLYGL
jgi:hypothetical protein